MRKGRSYPGFLGITVLALLITFTVSGVAGEPPALQGSQASSPVSLPPSAPATRPVPPDLNTNAVQSSSIQAAPKESASSAQPAGSPAASVETHSTKPLPLPVSIVSNPKPVPVLSAPAEEKEPDRVLSHTEVDHELAKEKDEGKAGDTSGFFVSAKGETGNQEEGLYDGLMGRIGMWMRYFQTTGRGKFELYLTRSGKYADMMRGILAKYGMPGDLIYLALIESGFSPKAYSVAKAAGPWQFIAETGRRYGLRIDWWTDERRDYEKSTHAAASYLKELYDMFDSWPLATAAYNAGEGKILRAVNRYNSADFVELIRHRYLKQETKDYVPKMIAALTIAKEPEKFGFGDVKYEAPLEFDKATVPGGTGLAALGKVIGVPYESLREWNPELRRFCTPPNRETYELRLPKGYGRIVEERMEEIRANTRVTFLLHSVKKGETLSSLAERYQTPASTLQELNGMKKPGLGRNARIIIPVVGLSQEEAVPGKEVSAQQVEAAFKRLDDGTRKSRIVKVRKGESLKAVANRAGVSVDDLAEANGLSVKSRVKAGRKLKVPGGGVIVAKKGSAAEHDGKKEMRHVVRRGDTLSRISRVYGVSLEKLSEKNSMKHGQVLVPGRVLLIPVGS
ncbi:MAG: LysM peptidoglycan-binding domain-containing protein [Deltaproteobacteria bacterium]|nr:LysM peptidoglycan-binding domain-containing protein [Deltaproteobacteria bacterium]